MIFVIIRIATSLLFASVSSLIVFICLHICSIGISDLKMDTYSRLCMQQSTDTHQYFNTICINLVFVCIGIIMLVEWNLNDEMRIITKFDL